MAPPEKKRENPAQLDDERRQPNSLEAGIGNDPADSRRTSDRTNVHDEGSDANDTPDGLTESEEAVRQAAEDIPTGGSSTGPIESVPVFERGSLPPKI
ncbi:hypothetical protein [Bosea sp. BH3]|uniref:hypothetical protein n=1 Tax=Bosea sp. BH3 TaxID=2871701 RepID=UPI0021CB4BD5|nr:hypothetical protein [Bosea sp. BH3]MCU4179227.1 hypothetical protein [Bosea sp. BH3]